ncbi:hypothetical protein GCM10010466_27530 [Planomonospora alba]|uniref:Uncharacterized protein n=1 Tax=Planomonospora alba TaxID=161354 RepID=A0ABP6N3X9_9ACTN
MGVVFVFMAGPYPAPRGYLPPPAGAGAVRGGDDGTVRAVPPFRVPRVTRRRLWKIICIDE